VSQPCIQAPAILLDAHQSPTLERLQVALGLDDLQKVHFEGFAEGQYVQRSTIGLIESTQASLDNFHQARRGRQAPRCIKWVW
jgi:hypothetical protein